MRHRKPAPNKQSEGSWPATYRWLATGTLVVYTAIGCHKVERRASPPAAHPSRPASHSRRPPRCPRSASIFPPAPPGRRPDLPQSHQSRSRHDQRGHRPAFHPRSLRRPHPGQALDQMLKNTGVHFRFTGATRVLELNSVAERVDVSASASALPTSISKYSEPLRDTPQTVNVVGQQVMARTEHHHPARCAAQRRGHQHRRRRRRRAGRQPDHPRLQRPQRSVYRWHARFRQLLPRPLQPRGSRRRPGTVLGHLRPRLHRRRRQPGHQNAHPAARLLRHLRWRHRWNPPRHRRHQCAHPRPRQRRRLPHERDGHRRRSRGPRCRP